MADKNTDFLRFNAYSMKELITRKLSENSKFTDQVYEGSNLAILIDLVSYMYQCLMFQLNNAAAESMFQDTQIYENINRLVNLIGYNPRGCYPCSMNVYLSTKDGQETVNIPDYAYFDTGKTDSQGRSICFSARPTDMEISGMDDTKIESDGEIGTTYYNGRWRLYGTVFTASGTENETFVLNLKSDREQKEYVSGEFIDVYVSSKGDVTQWQRDDDGVFANSTNISQQDVTNITIYGKNQKIFGVRLNEDKQYEIKFGSGVVGSKLSKGDLIYILYLDSNGPDGQIDLSEIDFSTLKLKTSASTLGLNDDIIDGIFGVNSSKVTDEELENVQVMQGSSIVSSFKYEESVDEVRQNGPSWFKLGNRLITRKDYEYFIKNSPIANLAFQGCDIADVKCMNNIEYAATFYKWLYQCGLQGRNAGLLGFEDGGRHYFNQQFWQRTDYKYIDPADGNNTYIWVKTGDISKTDYRDSYDIVQAENTLNDKLQAMKTMTTEIQVVYPVIVNFDICAANDPEYIRSEYMDDTQSVIDPQIESYIEITLDDNTLYASTLIQQSVYNIIIEAFNVNTCKLGQNINYSDMLNKIYAISGVERVRTIFKPVDSNRLSRVVDGLSFISWSPILNEGSGANGIDIDVSNTSRHLEDFQFPRFVGADYLFKRIRIIKKSLVTVNTIKM